MKPVWIVDYRQAGGNTHKHADHQNLTFEASALRLGRGQEFGSLFDDAVDVGMFIRSHRTGKLAAYSICRDGIKRDPDGDVKYWELQPVRASASMHHAREVSHWDAYKDTKVTIWNT